MGAKRFIVIAQSKPVSDGVYRVRLRGGLYQCARLRGSRFYEGDTDITDQVMAWKPNSNISRLTHSFSNKYFMGSSCGAPGPVTISYDTSLIDRSYKEKKFIGAAFGKRSKFKREMVDGDFTPFVPPQE